MNASRRSLLALVLLVIAISGGSEWWRGREQARLGVQIASASAPGDIEMLSSKTCVFCDRARAWIGEHQVPVNAGRGLEQIRRAGTRVHAGDTWRRRQRTGCSQHYRKSGIPEDDLMDLRPVVV